uniref:Uncharacterized protein n=1 Tax=Myoviridae sp. ctkfK18 TaxID=2825165 RepID=A0A8S5VGN0_9CAUD|nr:MAG TPA: hypothetical protein [Myoviridae sp. ctkfK18]
MRFKGFIGCFNAFYYYKRINYIVYYIKLQIILY